MLPGSKKPASSVTPRRATIAAMWVIPLVRGVVPRRTVSCHFFRDYKTLCSSYPRDELYERWEAHSYGLGKYDVKALLLRDQENQEITRCGERCSTTSATHQGMLTQGQHVPIAIFHQR